MKKKRKEEVLLPQTNQQMADALAVPQPSSPIARLAQDQLFSILLLLPVQSILCFAATCKRLKLLAYSDALWESVYRRDWGNLPADAAPLQLPWKIMYRQVYQLDAVYCHRLLLGSDDEWPCPRPRASHSLNLVSGCLVLFGGGCEGGRHLEDTWMAYAGVDDLKRRKVKWQKTSSGIPEGRFGHSCIVVGDYLVLFGGINQHGVRQNDTWIGQVTVQERLGDVKLSWRLLDVSCSSASPPSPRGAHAGCCIDSKRMLIHGGIGPSGVRLCDTWVLDLTEEVCFGTWREILTQPCPPPRSGHTLTHIGEAKNVLFGGRGSGYEVLNDVWLFDSLDGKWIQLAFDLCNSVPMPLPRVGHSANRVVGQRLLIYGGEDSNRNRKDDFWVLDVESIAAKLPRGKSWRRLEFKGGHKPKCRSFHGACVDNSGCYLYVHGGMVDGLVEPAGSSGLRFDGELFLVELILH
ncbi:F-box/kelch-repeat protein-like [Dorcoceras hygrometricum]|uniref:F-box/kelch-repeat protein-like n=1 Tax=Dorcoceras hygrometricum TaxID=472368 RepID=A0A2Z7AD78_9LAMI|nr:F-box/kelch-repeat protein-like [Dorcoceras hygrometricum]